jgi:Mn2+/Fe2+ NRAMP family transporter
MASQPGEKTRTSHRILCDDWSGYLSRVALNFAHIDPIRALFWAAVLNGMLAAPLMAVIMHMAASRKVMDKFTVPLYLRIVGWAATAVMLAVSIGVFVTQ